MDGDTAKNFLKDLSALLLDEALKSRQSAIDAKGSESEQFQSGRLMAYSEVVSLIQMQANIFGIDMIELGLSEIDADKDLRC